MKDHDMNLRTTDAERDTDARASLVSDNFDAARVFADPVEYLAGFGIRSELAEVHHNGFPAAA